MVRVTQSILLSIILVLFLSSCSNEYKGTFNIYNKSEKNISKISVKIADKSFTYKDIKINGYVNGTYLINSDSSYIIEVQFKSGLTLKKQLGYITNGMNFNHNIVITKKDINLEQSN